MRRTLIVFLLLNLILSACAPASTSTPIPAPSATPPPTVTPLPTATPTSTPTSTPTPIPTLSPDLVGGIEGIPDPRITNPELFDLKNPEAPIPQFVNALTNAGIDVSAEEVAQGITFVSTKEDGSPLVDKDGNPFVVAVYHLDPFLFPEQYRDLAGPIPLMMAERGERGWGWRKVELDIFFAKSGIKHTGALMDAGHKYPNILREFNTQTITSYDIPLGIDNETQQKLYNQEEREIKWRLSLGTRNHLIGSVITDVDPKFHNLPKDKKIEIIQQRLEMFNRYRIPNIIGITILNEAHEKRYTNEEIIMILQTARKIYPNMKLVYNDTENHYRNGMWTSYTRNFISRFGEYIDVVGVQMHLAQWPDQINRLPTPQDISSTLRSYGKEVWVTEFDINTAYLPGNQQEKKLMQANIAYNHIKGMLDSGVVTVFNIWGLTDNESWYNNFGGPEFKNAEALPFDKNGAPKLYYYYILKAVLDTLQQK
ncbi:endo-1,4-beta-xylanase [Vibrio sp.]|uniref:endo-1,4-beta-xylanase n=1 Tax=Vibrio sp. TaxID=678 RepID=UPI003D149B08